MTAVVPQKERVEEKEATKSRLCIILSKGTLDMAYPALMIATTAAAMGTEVNVFFTFWGIDAINRKKVGSLKVSPVGNPGMPMPNIIGMLPGMTAMATRMMNGKMKRVKMTPIPDMIKSAKELGVKFHACSTTVDVMGLKKEDLIPEVEDVVGAAAFIGMSEGGQVMFI